jgi:hypothetical protein
MTQDEIAAIVEGIAPVVRDYVKSALSEVGLRVQKLDVQLAGVVTATTDRHDARTPRRLRRAPR